ncbi:hypothetical protein ACFSFY_00140 [Sporosarcina siberiensis]|uniref:Ribbon-helix-helix protein, copG family n=1 Tax=Sporosarcina siberiensis TaxID=1365606 RepID=A0ABW4SB56_9BACL
MDLIIRNLNPATVRKLDELAKKNDSSRQEYLKEHFESFAVNDLHSSLIDRYEKQLEVNTMLLEKSADQMEELVTMFKELMLVE